MRDIKYLEAGDEIKRSRECAKLNQAEFAKILNIRAATLCYIEKGVNFPRHQTLIKMKKFFEQRNIPFDFNKLFI